MEWTDADEIAYLRSRVEELERSKHWMTDEIKRLNLVIADKDERLQMMYDEIARLREMVDASTSALERIYEIAIDWKPEPVPYCDDGGDMTMQPWDKSEPEPQDGDDAP